MTEQHLLEDLEYDLLKEARGRKRRRISIIGALLQIAIAFVMWANFFEIFGKSSLLISEIGLAVTIACMGLIMRLQWQNRPPPPQKSN